MIKKCNINIFAYKIIKKHPDVSLLSYQTSGKRQMPSLASTSEQTNSAEKYFGRKW